VYVYKRKIRNEKSNNIWLAQGAYFLILNFNVINCIFITAAADVPVELHGEIL
jgi:hypothetical protein